MPATPITISTVSNTSGPHLFYRVVIDSLNACGTGAAGYIEEVEFFIDGIWQVNHMQNNQTGTIGNRAATVEASSEWGICTGIDCRAWRAFDGIADIWNVYVSGGGTFQCTGNIDGNASLKVSFLGQPADIHGFRLTGNSGTAPDVFYLQYSDDGVNWLTIQQSISLEAATGFAVTRMW